MTPVLRRREPLWWAMRIIDSQVQSLGTRGLHALVESGFGLCSARLQAGTFLSKTLVERSKMAVFGSAKNLLSYLPTSSNSTSKISVALGGIAPPAPRAP